MLNDNYENEEASLFPSCNTFPSLNMLRVNWLPFVYIVISHFKIIFIPGVLTALCSPPVSDTVQHQSVLSQEQNFEPEPTFGVNISIRILTTITTHDLTSPNKTSYFQQSSTSDAIMFELFENRFISKGFDKKR